MSMTCITADFLREAWACKGGVAWYRAHPTVHDWPWEVVCAALEEDGQDEWSRWVRWAVAKFGGAEDRAALRNDPDEVVRRAVAIYGSAEDRAALRGDTHWLVRDAVVRCGRAEDRTALRSDPDAGVREAVAIRGRSDPR